MDMHSSDDFLGLKGIGQLVKRMVNNKTTSTRIRSLLESKVPKKPINQKIKKTNDTLPTSFISGFRPKSGKPTLYRIIKVEQLKQLKFIGDQFRSCSNTTS